MAKKEEKARKSKEEDKRSSSTDVFSKSIDDALGWNFNNDSDPSSFWASCPE